MHVYYLLHISLSNYMNLKYITCEMIIIADYLVTINNYGQLLYTIAAYRQSSG